MSLTRRAGSLVSLAAVSTLFVWSTATETMAKPSVGVAVLLLMVAGIIVSGVLSRPVTASASDGSPEVLEAAQRRPRPLREIPRNQRRRLWTLLACGLIIWALTAPAIVLATRQGAPLGQAAPLLLLLGLSVAAGVYVWHQIRYPSAHTLAHERMAPGYSQWRLRFITYLLLPVVLFLAGLAYQALKWNTALAVCGAFVTSMACLPGVIWAAEKFSTRRQSAN